MHIILGALTTLASLLWVLHRLAEMGIDLAGLNPFLWQRRRRFRKKMDGNPIYAVDSPMEATALLLAGIARADGDMSREEKNVILKIFHEEFGLAKTDAAGLLISSTYLLGRGEEFRDHLSKILKPSSESFSESQAKSAVELMNQVAQLSDHSAELKASLCDEARGALMPEVHNPSGWT